nr:MAG TPA: hypothetical protein [Caudoviricetes sp.]
MGRHCVTLKKYTISESQRISRMATPQIKALSGGLISTLTA